MASASGMVQARFSPNLGLAPCTCTHRHQHSDERRCKHTNSLLLGRPAVGDPLQRHGGPHQEWGTVEVSKGLPPKPLQQLAAGARAKPTTCLLKVGLNDAVPPFSPLPTLSNIIPWGNYHVYMRFSLFFFFNLFSAPCPIDPRGLAARLGLPASLNAGCFSQPPHGNLPQDNFGQCLWCFPANLYHLIPAGIDSPFLTRPPACWSSPILCSLCSPVEKPSVHRWGRDRTSNTPARPWHCLPGN